MNTQNIQMVCLECSTPLDYSETWVATADGPELEGLRYPHPLRPEGPWDHDPLPAMADGPVFSSCDCCGAQAPTAAGFADLWTISADRPLIMRIAQEVYDYSSPWSVCAACSAAIADDDLNMLLTQNGEHTELPEWISAEQREACREFTRELLLAFLAANPRLAEAQVM
jgi:hypothetical protein